MQLARVRDQVVSTIHHPAVDGQRLLVVTVVGADGRTPVGRAPLVAVDPLGARTGQLVVTCEEGKAARQVLQNDAPPVRTFILAIVDEAESDA
ncbi:MAG TPA: ethanolamine utilization protein EutN [Armatimonadetes bacterium]|nr:ethanolamine utilization protein EutN [Armatimonadota bacterium]